MKILKAIVTYFALVICNTILPSASYTDPLAITQIPRDVQSIILGYLDHWETHMPAQKEDTFGFHNKVIYSSNNISPNGVYYAKLDWRSQEIAMLQRQTNVLSAIPIYYSWPCQTCSEFETLFSPDSQFILFFSDKEAFWFDIQKQKALPIFQLQYQLGKAAIIFPQNTYIVFYNIATSVNGFYNNSHLDLYDIAKQKIVHRIKNSSLSAPQFSPDGNYLCYAQRAEKTNGEAELLMLDLKDKIQDYKIVHTITVPVSADSEISGFLFSPDKKKFVVQTIKKKNVPSGAAPNAAGAANPICCVEELGVYIYDVAQLSLIKTKNFMTPIRQLPRESSSEKPLAMQISPDGKYLAVSLRTSTAVVNLHNYTSTLAHCDQNILHQVEDYIFSPENILAIKVFTMFQTNSGAFDRLKTKAQSKLVYYTFRNQTSEFQIAAAPTTTHKKELDREKIIDAIVRNKLAHTSTINSNPRQLDDINSTTLNMQKKLNLEFPQLARYRVNLYTHKPLWEAWVCAYTHFEKQAVILDLVSQLQKVADKTQLAALIIELENFLPQHGGSLKSEIKKMIAKRVNELRRLAGLTESFVWE